MPGTQKSLRLPERIVAEIEEIAKDERRDFTAVTAELLEEAVKARRFPGIVVSEGVRGRRARVAGTGVEVWEIEAVYRSVGRDRARLRKALDRLTEQQISAALAYSENYKDEVDRLVAANEGWTPELVRQKYPFLPVSPGR
ncbi:MAG: DUF433 domain-containing protein [Deltaproteobacteria bacterium]|nr:DUF433 domain-containing protein [Deltaproteobacteria bacterium]